MRAIGLTLDAVSRRFDTVEAIRALSLEIPPGEFVALLGPSGCGKTTVLRMLGGLDSPTSGAIRFDPAPEQVSYCFQEPRLLPWSTVRDNIALPLTLRHVPDAARAPAVDELLALVELEAFAAHRPHQLSGGMRMRVALARALVTAPQLLLLDEPFGALDAITRGVLDDALRHIARTRGMTVVLVTHSIGEAVYLADTVHVLAPRPGRLVESIPVDLPERRPELRATPEFAALVAHAFSALERGARSAA